MQDGEDAKLIPDEGNVWFRFTAVDCPECAFDMEELNTDHSHPVPDHVTDQLKRHEAYIAEFRGESARMWGAVTTDLSYIKSALDKLTNSTERHDQRLDHLEREIHKYNNLRERLDLLEKTHDRLASDFVPRPEFNGALNSIREQSIDGDNSIKEALQSGLSSIRWVLGGLVGGMFALAMYLIFGA